MFRFLHKSVGYESLRFDSDCHCHLLPSVDDGAKTRDESLSILSEMTSAGIKQVTFTPHINPEMFPDNEEWKFEQQFSEFKATLPEEITSQIKLSLGAEYMVVNGFEKRSPEELLQFRPGKVLIEMSYYYISKTIEQTIFNFEIAGIKPVIAHPERYCYLSDSLETFEKYHDMGAEFQLNLLSLGGAYGPQSIRILEFILKNGWYSYLGSDTHSLAHFKTIENMKFSPKYLEYLNNVQ